MLRQLRRFTRNSVGSVAVETAIFAPVFLVMTLGITDLGTGMFVKMTVNAAAQAGAAYAAINTNSTCTSLTAACLSGIETTMNDAANNSSFCTGTVCLASIGTCTDGSPKCISVTANYPYTPFLPDAVYTWAGSPQTYSSTITMRIQ
jgi:Flp pilus assembly protein TadG